MEDRSTLSVPAYILEYFFYAGIFIVWMDIFGMPDFAVPFTRTTLGGTQSGYVLAVMMLVSAFVGMVLTMRRYRTTFHVLVHLGTPICLYFLIALIRYSPILALIQGIVILTALSVYVLLLCTDLPEADRAYYLHRRFRGFPRRAWALLSVALLLSPVAYYLRCLAGNPMNLNVPRSYPDELGEELALVSGLKEENWQKLSEEEKRAVLEAVVEIESSYLGLAYVPLLDVVDMEEGHLGGYVRGRDHILINLSELMEEDGWSALDTLCHEVYHAYQEMQVELYEDLDSPYREMELFHDAAVYAEEFRDYKDGDEDGYDLYYEQQCEEDARNYAYERSLDYYTYLMGDGG